MIYLSSSWKNRDRVRALAVSLRHAGFEVYDFTDPACRNVPEIPPEKFPENFDPEKHVYGDYITAFPEWRAAVDCNRNALDRCEAVILLLPCGNDGHADAYYALGKNKRLIVAGQPKAGDRTPTHMWAEKIVPTDEDALDYMIGSPP